METFYIRTGWLQLPGSTGYATREEAEGVAADMNAIHQPATVHVFSA